MSNLYHKIPSIYKREEQRPFNLIEGEYSEPELELLKDVQWVFTEKVDGTNIRVIWDGHKVTYGGRTDNADMPRHQTDMLESLFGGSDVEQMFEQVFGEANVVLYGEAYGAKIAKGGGNYSDTQKFVLFDVKVGDIYLERHNVEDIASKFTLDVVPIVATGTLEEGVKLVKDGLKSQWGDFLAEGLVAKPAVDLFDRTGHRIITKIKHRDLVKK